MLAGCLRCVTAGGLFKVRDVVASLIGSGTLAPGAPAILFP
jgi:hypothetical protein